MTRTLSNTAYQFPIATNASRSYVANGLNQYTQISSPTVMNPTWDAKGNLSWDGATTFTYDSENRLVGASGAKTANLVYDPQGRIYETYSPSTGTTRFLYDGDALVAEYSSSGTLLRRYVHGPGLDEPLVWYEGAAVNATTRRYLHADHQGSVIAIAGGTGSTIAANFQRQFGGTQTVVEATTSSQVVANAARYDFTDVPGRPMEGIAVPNEHLPEVTPCIQNVLSVGCSK